MVYANYYTPYTKPLYVRYEVNMWCIYCMTLLLLELFTPFFLYHMTNPNLKFYKWKNMKINQKEKKIRKKIRKK